eukprot:SAG11_NODE_9016_length_953_cov_1.264637_1_plen_62_part_00
MLAPCAGLYRVFPNAEFGVVSAWAWAVHRAVDALLMLSAGDVDDVIYLETMDAWPAEFELH